MSRGDSFQIRKQGDLLYSNSVIIMQEPRNNHILSKFLFPEIAIEQDLYFLHFQQAKYPSFVAQK